MSKSFPERTLCFIIICACVSLLTPLLMHGETPDKPPINKKKLVTPGKSDKNFQLKLNIQNGHIGHVFIGCDAKASDEFDNQLDDMAPPPGMGGVGYTFLVSPNRQYNLYKDMRGFSDTVQWVFYARTGVKPVSVSWDPKSIPAGWDLFCSPWDGKSEEVPSNINCREITSVKTDKTGFFRFWISRPAMKKE